MVPKSLLHSVAPSAPSKIKQALDSDKYIDEEEFIRDEKSKMLLTLKNKTLQT